MLDTAWRNRSPEAQETTRGASEVGRDPPRSHSKAERQLREDGRTVFPETRDPGQRPGWTAREPGTRLGCPLSPPAGGGWKCSPAVLGIENGGTKRLGWGCSSVVPHLPGKCKVLSLSPSTKKNKSKQRDQPGGGTGAAEWVERENSQNSIPMNTYIPTMQTSCPVSLFAAYAPAPPCPFTTLSGWILACSPWRGSWGSGFGP